MNSIQVKAGAPLKGSLRVPGDKSISHRSLLLAALADGDSTIFGLSRGEDVLGTAAAIAAVGATVTGASVSDNGKTVHVSGGKHRLHAPDHAIDLGNSGTGARLMIGWLSSFEWESTLTGDASLSTRPMRRVVDPLREMGAQIEGRDNGEYLPLTVKGGALKAIDYTPPVRSAQVKTAVLLAGLAADGTTVVHEPVPSRAHTEEMLLEFGADIKVHENLDGSCSISVRRSEIKPFEFDVPCDPSAAAFWMVAASVVPDSDVTLENVYVGPGRGGLLDVLVRMGADIDITHTTATTANIRVRHSQLTATDVGEDEIVSLVDEIPVLSVAAAFASGSTVVSDAEELRVKETASRR